jgi:hypothetical protein
MEPVLALLAELSPTVEWEADPAACTAATRHEPAARYAVFLDGTGLTALYGSEARLGRLIVRELWERLEHTARVGIADGRYAALLAAMRGVPTPPALRGDLTLGPSPPQRGAEGEVSPAPRGEAGMVASVPAGNDAAFLAPLPVSLLPLPLEARERLAVLGARTLHEFSRLPANAVRHRFGPDGLAALALAAGRDEGPLRPRPTPLQLHDTLELEWVETSLDRLLFLLKRLADRLSVRLAHHGLGCGRLRIVWLLDEAGLTTGDDLVDATGQQDGTRSAPPDDGTAVSIVRLAEPAGSGASLLEHLRWHVEGLRPERFRHPQTGQQRGVRGILVEAEELAPLGGRQLALLPGEDGRTAHPERLLAAERTLARLQARWGETSVQQAELVASRRPETAFRWREPEVPLPPTQLPTRAVRRRGGKLVTPFPHLRRREGSWGGRGDRGIPWWGAEVTPLRLSRQPEGVQVERGGRQPNGRRRPGMVTVNGRVRRIVRAAGPWRLVERWAAEPVARDTYHVVLADGAACWLVHDRLTDRWLLLGTFD